MDVEAIVEQVLTESGALEGVDRLQISLRKVAQFLGCELHFTKGDLEQRRQFRATVSLDSEHKWHIAAGDPSHQRTREAVAHELGHVILYKPAGELRLDLWQSRKWTIEEEWMASYIARCLLVPHHLLRRPKLHENLAEYLVSEIQGRFHVTQETAAFRWLDLEWKEATETVAAIIWRQFHPFESRFLTAVARRGAPKIKRMESNLKTLLDLIRESSIPLAQLAAATEWQQAVIWWRKALKADVSDAPTEIENNFEPLNLIRTAIRALPESEQNRICEQLKLGTFAPTFFPQTVLLRTPMPPGCFIPVRRGGLRNDSQAHRLAISSSATDGNFSQEKVEIGDLRGVFISHGFCHGSASNGTRFIVQLLCNDPRENVEPSEF